MNSCIAVSEKPPHKCITMFQWHFRGFFRNVGVFPSPVLCCDIKVCIWTNVSYLWVPVVHPVLADRHLEHLRPLWLLSHLLREKQEVADYSLSVSPMWSQFEGLKESFLHWIEDVVLPRFPCGPSWPSRPLSPWGPRAPLAPGFPAFPWQVEAEVMEADTNTQADHWNWACSRTYSFSWWSQRPSGARGSDECAVVDGAALGALGPDGGGVLGDLGCDHTSAQLQDLLVGQTRTLPDRNHSGRCA